MDAWSSNPVLTCRSCGTELPFDARFCWQCGTPVNPATPVPTEPEPEPVELDEETVREQLFSLINFGYTDVSALPNPEPVRKAMRRLLNEFPHLAYEPYGKERRTLLHDVAFGVALSEHPF